LIACTENDAMKVLLVNGVAQAGKDTFIDALAACGEYEVFKISIIDYVKDLARTIGWDGEKDEAGRQLLCDLLTVIDKYNDAPSVKVLYEVDEWFTNTLYTNHISTKCKNKPCLACIIAREAKHLDLFRKYYTDIGVPVKSVLLEREIDTKSDTSNNTPNNKADQEAAAGAEAYPYDFYIVNTDGLFDDVFTAAAILDDIFASNEEGEEGEIEKEEGQEEREDASTLEKRADLIRTIKLYHPDKAVRERLFIDVTGIVQFPDTMESLALDSHLLDALLNLLAAQAFRPFLSDDADKKYARCYNEVMRYTASVEASEDAGYLAKLQSLVKSLHKA
jgi:hypothetical protein